ncbi:hypothetical protein D3C83_302790 [compost metagenome]
MKPASCDAFHALSTLRIAGTSVADIHAPSTSAESNCAATSVAAADMRKLVSARASAAPR